MPRKAGIYRTIKMCDVECVCLDLKKKESYTEVFETLYTTDRKKLFKQLSKEFNSKYKTRKLVHISKVVPKDKKYFISMSNFLKVAEAMETEEK